MENEKYLQELKEKEIKRLTTPLTRKKIKENHFKYYDREGNLTTSNIFGKRIIEPKTDLLSFEEILQYAPNSREASKVRLKTGVGNLKDKFNLHLPELFWMGIISLFIVLIGFNYSFNLGIALFISVILCYVFYFFIYDFKEENITKTIDAVSEGLMKTPVKETKLSPNEELLMLFKSKEKIAREMIERKFPSPQMTNTKFNSVLDNYNEVVESQIEILNALTPTEKTKYEIESRKKLIKQLISKIDDLTNELILSEKSSIEEAIEEMDDLINSVQKYE